MLWRHVFLCPKGFRQHGFRDTVFVVPARSAPYVLRLKLEIVPAMTIFFALLGLLLLTGVGLAVEILRSASSAPQYADAGSLRDALDRLAAYEPMRRLFSKGDRSLVDADSKLQGRLQASRRKAMSLYLKQLRRDFMCLWSACRLLAPVSQDNDFVVKLVSHLFRFHLVYFALRLRCAAGFWMSVEADAKRMADMLSGLRAQGGGLLQATAASGA